MTQNSQQPVQPHRLAGGQRPYRSPTLSTYGALRELTTGGSGNFIENTGKDSQPTKRP